MNFKYLRLLRSAQKLYLCCSSLRLISSNEVVFQVFSNGSLHSSKSLFIVTANERYLINCGEGTQKIFSENSKKLTSIRNIFFTRSSQQNLCGIIGLSMGIDCNNTIDLYLHGIKDSVELIKASRAFYADKIFRINYHDSSTYEDSVFNITSFKYTGTDSSHRDECVGYLFSTKQVGPTINYSKCLDFGISKEFFKSKKMNEFTSMSHVTLHDGRIIESKHVLNDPRPSNKCLVIECPTVGHVTGMNEALPLDKFIDDHGHLSLIFHLTERSIFDHISYQQLIQRINSTFVNHPPPTHVVIDSTSQFPLSYSTYYLQTCLNYFFDGQMFPKLKLYEDYIATNSLKNGDSTTEHGVDSAVIFAEPFMDFHVNNIHETNNNSSEMWTKLKFLNEKDIIDEVLNKNEYFPPEYMMEKMKNLKEELTAKKESLQENDSCRYPNITFLGTNSSSPSKYRNVSSILVEPNADVFVLFDAGEGTLDRMITLHGVERAQQIVRNLRVIFISHYHMDHHLGLYQLLRYRQLIGNCKPCLILSGGDVHMFTTKTDSIFGTKHCLYNCNWCHLDLLPIVNNKFGIENRPNSLSNYENELALQLTPVRVFHTNTSYGLVLSGHKSDSTEPWKVTYSGDSCPRFSGLVTEGVDSDILIHEATFDDGLIAMAARKRHSTVTQAIEEGIKMRAKFTMLTHFSSRYCVVPPVEKKYQNVAQAFDFMKVDLRSCHYLKILDPYLEYLFPRHWNELMKQRQQSIRKYQC